MNSAAKAIINTTLFGIVVFLSWHAINRDGWVLPACGYSVACLLCGYIHDRVNPRQEIIVKRDKPGIN